MKFVKKFTAIFAAILVTVCLAVFAVACEDNNGDNNGDGNNITDGNGGNNNNDNNNDQYATDTFTVKVFYEDGTTPVDGTKHRDGGDWMWDAVSTVVSPYGGACVQFCAVLEDGSLGACDDLYNLDENGVATVNLSGLVTVANSQHTKMVELHVKEVKSYGYTDGEKIGVYGRFEIDKIPLEITVTLQTATAE